MNYKDLWNYIGSVWSTYDDKPTMELFWEALNSGVMRGREYGADLQRSRSLPYMPPSFNIGPEFYNVTYSGVDDTWLTVRPTGSGTQFEFAIPEWSYSVPTLTYEYVYNGVTYSGVYNENTDYIVSGYNSIHWLGASPTADPRYPSYIKRANLYAEKICVINPMLMNTWAIFCKFSINYYSDYLTYGQEKYQHLKMLIWALVHKQMQAPSIKNLRDMFAISRGMPFAYESGINSNTYVTDHYETSIGSYTYVLPAGMTPVTAGTSIGTFDLIASGITLDDIHSNSGLVTNHSNSYNRRNTLVFTLGSGVTTHYNTTFHDSYVNKIMPKQLQWFVI